MSCAGLARVGFIVDGPGDFAALKARAASGCRVVKTDGPRGHTVPPRALARSAKKQVMLLKNVGCQAAVLLVDAEGRNDYATFVSDLRREVAGNQFQIPVYVAAPNRMIENWYLADVVSLSTKRSYIKPGLSQKNYEGTDGKAKLKALFSTGHAYNEVKHAASLFKAIELPTAERNSASFAEFLDIASHHLD